MADRVLFISWGPAVRGREKRALAVFGEAVAFYGRLKERGAIEDFHVVALDPNGDLGGYAELTGSPEQLVVVAADEDYRRLLTAAGLVVDRLRVIEGDTGAGLAKRLKLIERELAAAEDDDEEFLPAVAGGR
jgi:hypothetical protein